MKKKTKSNKTKSLQKSAHLSLFDEMSRSLRCGVVSFRKKICLIVASIVTIFFWIVLWWRNLRLFSCIRLCSSANKKIEFIFLVSANSCGFYEFLIWLIVYNIFMYETEVLSLSWVTLINFEKKTSSKIFSLLRVSFYQTFINIIHWLTCDSHNRVLSKNENLIITRRRRWN